MAKVNTMVLNQLKTKLSELKDGLRLLSWWRRKNVFDAGIERAYVNLEEAYYHTRYIVTVLSGSKETIQPSNDFKEYFYAIFPPQNDKDKRLLLITNDIAIERATHITEIEGLKACKIWAQLMLLQVQAIRPEPDNQLQVKALENIESRLILVVEYLYDEVMERKSL